MAAAICRRRTVAAAAARRRTVATARARRGTVAARARRRTLAAATGRRRTVVSRTWAAEEEEEKITTRVGPRLQRADLLRGRLGLLDWHMHQQCRLRVEGLPAVAATELAAGGTTNRTTSPRGPARPRGQAAPGASSQGPAAGTRPGSRRGPRAAASSSPKAREATCTQAKDHEAPCLQAKAQEEGQVSGWGALGRWGGAARAGTRFGAPTSSGRGALGGMLGKAAETYHSR